MGIGASLGLFAVGAIVTFALELRVGWLDLDVAGWVLMVTGAVGLILTLTIWSGRRRSVSSMEPVRERRVIEDSARVDYDDVNRIP